MVRRCVMTGCRRRQGQGVRLWRFPRSPNRRAAWVQQTGKENFVPGPSSAICELHFKPEMWERKRVDGTTKLKISAVPFRDSSDNEPHPTPYVLHIPYRDHDYFRHPTMSPISSEDAMNAVEHQNKPAQDLENKLEEWPYHTSSEHNYSTVDCSNVNVLKKQLQSSSICVMSSDASSGGLHSSSSPLPTLGPTPAIQAYCYDDPCHNKASQTDLPLSKEQQEMLELLMKKNEKIKKLLQENKDTEKELEELKSKCNKHNTAAIKLSRVYHTLRKNVKYYQQKHDRLQVIQKQSLSNLQNYLNHDQILALGRNSTRGFPWSAATCAKSLQFKSKLGIAGYNYLISKLPIFPSVRTLQKKAEECTKLEGTLEASALKALLLTTDVPNKT